MPIGSGKSGDLLTVWLEELDCGEEGRIHGKSTLVMLSISGGSLLLTESAGDYCFLPK
jgi:hypothetical protein